MDDLEQRIKALEEFRVRAGAHLSASSSIAISAWVYLLRNQADPVDKAREITESFKKGANFKSFKNIPADVDKEEYRKYYLEGTDKACAVIMKTLEQMRDGLTLDDVIAAQDQED